MENLKKENFTDYQFENLGGQWGQYGSYKRNKRDIKKYIKYDGRYFELFENISGYYNKALIYKEINKNNYILLSYETVVSEYKENKMILYGWYSMTTANHINAFLHRFNYASMGKQAILKNINKEF